MTDTNHSNSKELLPTNYLDPRTFKTIPFTEQMINIQAPEFFVFTGTGYNTLYLPTHLSKHSQREKRLSYRNLPPTPGETLDGFCNLFGYGDTFFNTYLNELAYYCANVPTVLGKKIYNADSTPTDPYSQSISFSDAINVHRIRVDPNEEVDLETLSISNKLIKEQKVTYQKTGFRDIMAIRAVTDGLGYKEYTQYLRSTQKPSPINNIYRSITNSTIESILYKCSKFNLRRGGNKDAGFFFNKGKKDNNHGE